MPIDSATSIAGAIDSRHRRSQKATTASPKKVKCHKPARESTKTIVNRLYSLWSQVVRTRAGNKCEVCGATGVLDAHHIQPRQICSGLRFDPMNGVCLCKSHHKFGRQSAHKGMMWFVEWLRQNLPERFSYVMEHLDDELDCGDRVALYGMEHFLYYKYSDILGRLPVFTVTVQLKSGIVEDRHVDAHNKKAAEYLSAHSMGYSDDVKGVIKTAKWK